MWPLSQTSNLAPPTHTHTQKKLEFSFVVDTRRVAI